MTARPTHDASWTCHWWNYGKLLDPDNSDGAIRRGAEHRLTGRSRDAPENLNFVTRPDSYGTKLNETASAIGRDFRATGAFVAQALATPRGEWAIFARLAAWPESGEGGMGRVFSQVSVLATALDGWTRDLPLAAYEALFNSARGLPQFERNLQADPLILRAETAARRVLPPDLRAAFETPPQQIAAHSPCRIIAPDIVQALALLHRQFAPDLITARDAAALPFALGSVQGIDVPGGGYAFVMDHREEVAEQTSPLLPLQIPRPFKARPPAVEHINWKAGSRNATIEQVTEQVRACQTETAFLTLLPGLEHTTPLPDTKPGLTAAQILRLFGYFARMCHETGELNDPKTADRYWQALIESGPPDCLDHIHYKHFLPLFFEMQDDDLTNVRIAAQHASHLFAHSLPDSSGGR